jgi:hypothetical protein
MFCERVSLMLPQPDMENFNLSQKFWEFSLYMTSRKIPIEEKLPGKKPKELASRNR